MEKRSVYVAVVMAFVLVLAACGGGDGETLLDQSSGSTADGGGISPSDSLPNVVGDIPGVSGECVALVNLFLSIGGAFLGGGVSSLDSDTLANLPSEIRDDAQFVSETLTQFSDGLQDLGIDLTDPTSLATMTEAQQAAFSALSDSMDTDGFNTATDNLSAYGEQECESQFAGVG